MSYSKLRLTSLADVMERSKRIKLCFDIHQEEHPNISIKEIYDDVSESGVSVGLNRFYNLRRGDVDCSNIDIITAIAYQTDVSVRFITRGDVLPARFGTIRKHVNNWPILSSLPDSMQSGVIKVSKSAKELLFKS